jgi:hypothetical protein
MCNLQNLPKSENGILWCKMRKEIVGGRLNEVVYISKYRPVQMLEHTREVNK